MELDVCAPISTPCVVIIANSYQVFHHDGPFDALNPHRNRNTSRRAPMQAFPKDSLNNSLGGSGPLNAQADHSTFMGRGTEEAFREYSGNHKTAGGYNYPKYNQTAIIDATARGDVIHGDESHGLGTSTFLEGTPAARAAIVRRDQEQIQQGADAGLQRKKSLAQRIRHINKGRPERDFSPSGRLTSPEARYGKGSPDVMPSGSAPTESNPFFSEFSKGEETLSTRPRDGGRSPASPPPIPRRMSGGPLERRATTDASMAGDEMAAAAAAATAAAGKSSGLLGRMKSFKGGRKPRGPEVANNPPPNPGTAV